MVHLGRKVADGGYIVPDVLLDAISVIYNYGIGDDASFELDFLTLYPDKVVRSFDHTIQTHPSPAPGIVFYKEGLSSGVTKNTSTFENHLIKCGDENKLVLLKLDVEGAEYDYIKSADINVLRKSVGGIILELHWLDDNLDDALRILGKLRQHFKCVHWHNNNWGSIFSEGSLFFPTVVELTMVNSEKFDLNPSQNELPRDNDVPCRPEMPEFHFDLNKGSEVNHKQMVRLALELRDKYILSCETNGQLKSNLASLESKLAATEEEYKRWRMFQSKLQSSTLHRLYEYFPECLRNLIKRNVDAFLQHQ
jgi:hypothetical protein